ncbi:HAD family hydrolase [bacterium]|nr:HAD family hydrolase [bacterium]
MALRRGPSKRDAARESVAQLKKIRSRVSLAPEWWTGKTHVLIDMDGTLIGQPGALFHNLFAVFALLRLSALGSYGELYRAVNKTIRIVLSQHQYENNEDAFFETLARELNVTRQKLERFAGRFFDSDYPFICLFLHSESHARRLLDLLHATGRHVTLATNAIFGRREIELRLKASDLYLHDFDLVTSWDVMKSTKPHTAFFEETLRKIGGAPESTVMIGNDPFYDLPAHQLGIDTLLVGARLSIGNIADSLEATFSGSDRL